MVPFVDNGSIGYFGDTRRQNVGIDLFQSIVKKGHLCIRGLAGSRAEQVRFQRFLWADEVNLDELKREAFSKTSSLAKGAEHILCMQDTTELDFSKRQNDIVDMGTLKDRDSVGCYLHPVLAMDPKDDFVLGLCGFTDFDYDRNRKKRNNSQENRKPIEEKSSFRWLQCAEEAKSTLSSAKMITIISDRESDIYEYLARIPDEKTHLLVRSRLERPVSEAGEQHQWMSQAINDLSVVETRQIEVPYKKSSNSVGSKIKKLKDREKRIAEVELRYSELWVHIPQSRSIKKSKDEARKVRITVVDVKEICPPNAEIDLIHWRLLTTHSIENASEAWEVVSWYRKRWHIEQLFRSAKRGGMRLEDIALSRGDCIKKLAFIGLLASIRILQLTLCRTGEINRSAKISFSKTEIQVLKQLKKKYEGKTLKQKNPYKTSTMAWAYWIVGRIGGWKGYVKSEGPAGPLTLKRGLDEFSNIVKGWELAN